MEILNRDDIEFIRFIEYTKAVARGVIRHLVGFVVLYRNEPYELKRENSYTVVMTSPRGYFRHSCLSFKISPELSEYLTGLVRDAGIKEITNRKTENVFSLDPPSRKERLVTEDGFVIILIPEKGDIVCTLSQRVLLSQLPVNLQSLIYMQGLVGKNSYTTC